MESIKWTCTIIYISNLLVPYQLVHVILVNVYAPNNNDPDFFLDLFATLELDDFDFSWLIIAGDFNIALGPLDYHGTQSCYSNVNSRNQSSYGRI